MTTEIAPNLLAYLGTLEGAVAELAKYLAA
jgi:hypothetical protein